MVNNMMIVDGQREESNCTYNAELNERVMELEKANNELNDKINQRDAYLRVCYVNIALLSTLLLIIGVLFVVKKVRKSK